MPRLGSNSRGVTMVGKELVVVQTSGGSHRQNIGKQEATSDFRNANLALSVVQGSDCCSDIRGKPVQGFCGAIGLRPDFTDFTHFSGKSYLP